MHIRETLIVRLCRRVDQAPPKCRAIFPAQRHPLRFVHHNSIHIAWRESCNQPGDLRRHSKQKARDMRLGTRDTPRFHQKIACEGDRLTCAKPAPFGLPRSSGPAAVDHPTPPLDALKIEIEEHHGTARRAAQGALARRSP